MSENKISCLFPGNATANGVQQRPLTVRVELSRAELIQQLLSSPDGTTSLVNAAQAAWALLLRTYTGLDNICFGIQDIGGRGSGSNTDHDIIFAMNIEEGSTVEDLLAQVGSGNCVQSAPKQGSVVYNTAMLLRFAGANSAQSATGAVMPDSVRCRIYALEPCG